MDLLKQTFESFNPNFEKLTKYTIRLGEREWETTVLRECTLFLFSFIEADYLNQVKNPFKVSSAPYSGSPINSVVNTKQ